MLTHSSLDIFVAFVCLCSPVFCFGHVVFLLYKFTMFNLAELNKNTDSGFSAGLVEDSNPFEWQVILTGPPDTW